MNYPTCPDQRTDCRFQSEGGSKTLMYNPIVYSRTGQAVGGGSNKYTQLMRCHKCNKRWVSTQTELEDAQGKNREWVILESPAGPQSDRYYP